MACPEKKWKMNKLSSFSEESSKNLQKIGDIVPSFKKIYFLFLF